MTYIVEREDKKLSKTAETKERAEQMAKHLEKVYNQKFNVKESVDVWGFNYAK